MTRCLPLARPFVAAWLAFLCASLHLTVASAQTGLRVPSIPPSAQAGLLRVTQPPEVLLNGQPARLSPGARIRGRDNLLVLSATLVEQELPVRYTRDMLGLVHEAWILTEDELRAAQGN